MQCRLEASGTESRYDRSRTPATRGDALDWEPSIDARDIGVSVDEGVVTLRGTVGSYTEKVNAERTTERVYGVKAVANDLSVRLISGYERTDTEIAQAAAAALAWNTVVPEGRVTATVITAGSR